MRYCIVSAQLHWQSQQALKKLSYSLLFTRPCPMFAPPLAYHPDLQLLPDGEGGIYSLGYTPLPPNTLKLRLVKTDPQLRGYLAEAKLNVFRVGGYLFANTHCCADLSIPRDVKIIHVNQGYANCSSIAVGDHAVITDDAGIAQAVKGEGLECLLCQKGDVKLPGYPYGFLGGASLCFPDGSIGFFGEIEKHQNANEILSFLKSHGVRYITLQKGPLYDYGGGIVF